MSSLWIPLKYLWYVFPVLSCKYWKLGGLRADWNVHRAFFYFRVFVIDHPPPRAAPTEEMPPLEGEEDEDASRMEEVD